MIEIELPYNKWTPRDHQQKLWDYLRGGGKRAVAVWHRRAGKDDVTLHHTAVAMAERVANYWHLLPEFEQGRRIANVIVNTNDENNGKAAHHSCRGGKPIPDIWISHATQQDGKSYRRCQRHSAKAGNRRRMNLPLIRIIHGAEHLCQRNTHWSEDENHDEG